MYSLDSAYYKKSFSSFEALIEDIISSGMDPSYEITFNEELTGEFAIDHIVF